MADIIDSANFHAEVNTELLERLLIHGDNEKEIRAIIKKVLNDARKRVAAYAKSVVGRGYRHSHGDPREAYRAVKHSVYKAILGGNISILNKRKAGAPNFYAPPRKLRKGQRGGNRIHRSKRTVNLMSYWGSDRGFVLRFRNSGTSDRESRFGNRGRIAARRWFGVSANKEMERAAQELSSLVSKAIIKHFNNGK